jgi:hypothetical protein
VISELNIIKNFEIITERFGLGNPVEDTFPNGESNKLFTKANHKVTDSSSLQAAISEKEYLK